MNVLEGEFLDFLKLAHQYGWPNYISLSTNPNLHGFEETSFRSGDWEFYDLYGGMITDIGFETIFYRGKSFWGAAYRGGVMRGDLDPQRVFSFLIEALDAPNDQAIPLRGPSVYRGSDNQLTYWFKMRGDISSFIAVEEITNMQDTVVYERLISGGVFGDAYYGRLLAEYVS